MLQAKNNVEIDADSHSSLRKMLNKLSTMTKFLIHINDIKSMKSIDEFLLHFYEGLPQGSLSQGMVSPQSCGMTVSTNDAETHRYVTQIFLSEMHITEQCITLPEKRTRFLAQEHFHEFPKTLFEKLKWC